MLRRLALLFSFSWALLQAAQDPRFVVSHYGPEHGLSNRHVLSLVQDRTGFIWAGTVSGLDRFDGHAFRNWSVSDGLSQGRADILRRDAHGRIWAVATDLDDDIISIDVLDPATGQILPLEQRHAALPFGLSTVKRIAPQRDDEIIVLGTANPAQCIRFDGTVFTVHRLDGDRFDPLGHDRSGNIIGCLHAGSTKSIVRIAPDGSTQSAFALPAGTTVEQMVSGRTSAGALYRCTSADSRARYYDTYSEVTAHGMPVDMSARAGTDPVVRPLNLTPLPNRALRMVDAALINDEGEALFDLAAAHPEVKRAVKGCWLDRVGNPWLATEFGLFRIDIRGDYFARLLHDERAEGRVGHMCRGMDWHNGMVYLATEWHGAFRVDPASGKHESLGGTPFLFGLRVGKDGTVWRGGRGVVEWNKPNEALRSVAIDDNIWSLLPIGDGMVLLGGEKGIWMLDPRAASAKRLNDPHHPELEHAHILQLRRFGDGRIEAVGSKGIYRLAPDGSVLQRLWAGAEQRERLPFDDLHHAFTSADGALWLSTRGAGLIRFDPRTGSHQQYAMRNGFPNNMVYAAYPDAHGQLWLPTDGGIVRFDLQSRQSAVFTMADGLANDEFNRLAHIASDHGTLYFGGLNGITAFDPKSFTRMGNEARPPLVLTSVMRHDPQQGGMVDATGDVDKSGRLVLRKSDGSLRVGFALLSFEGTGRIGYAWRFTSSNGEWTYQHEPFVRFDQLPQGEHVMRVKARDASGYWNPRELELRIEVRAEWTEHRATWAGAGAAGALVLFVLGGRVLRRMRKLQRARRMRSA